MHDQAPSGPREIYYARQILSQRLAERITRVGGRPRHAGVGDQCEAERLAGPVAEVAANVALMGEEQVTAQGVRALALAELAAYRRRSSSPATWRQM